MSAIRQTPNTDPEWARDIQQRVKALESSSTTRVGSWVLSETEDGRLLAQRPGLIQDVGNPITEEVDITALRGYVSPNDIAKAVSGGKTSSLPAATQNQIDKDSATATAQYVAETANSIAARLDAQVNSGVAGYVFSDGFDRPYATDLGSDYFRTIPTGGPGQYGTDGSGNAAPLFVSGSLPQDWIDRHIVPANTDRMVTSTTLAAVPAPSGGFGTVPASHGLLGRMNSTNTDYVQATVENGYVGMSYVLGGVGTAVVPGTPWPMGAGDRWDLLCLDTPDPEYYLLRNGLTTISWTDLGGLYPVDSAHRYGGMYNRSGNVVSFWITQQTGAPIVQIFNFADRA